MCLARFSDNLYTKSILDTSLPSGLCFTVSSIDFVPLPVLVSGRSKL